MILPFYQVDAFTSTLFRGNPAAVCPLETWLDDSHLQAIAAENNLSETAFFVPRGDDFELRWFTPGCEIDLCGHATLASAFVLYHCRGRKQPSVVFHSKSGPLVVTWSDGLLTLDFPSRPPSPVTPDPKLEEAIGTKLLEILAAKYYLVVLGSEAEVRALAPDMALLARLDHNGVIVTAPGDSADFVSRFFTPAQGVPEDPVTGAAHCTLIPYWSARLGKKQLHAFQVSRRGGELWLEDRGDRVSIAGRAVLYAEGKLHV